MVPSPQKRVWLLPVSLTVKISFSYLNNQFFFMELLWNHEEKLNGGVPIEFKFWLQGTRKITRTPNFGKKNVVLLILSAKTFNFLCWSSLWFHPMKTSQLKFQGHVKANQETIKENIFWGMTQNTRKNFCQWIFGHFN